MNNKHTACLERSMQGGTFPYGLPSTDGNGNGHASSLAWELRASFDQLEHCRALWLLVILCVLLPCPHLLTDLHVCTNILGVQLVSSTIVGWPVKEVVLTPGQDGYWSPSSSPPSIKNNRARSTSDICSDVQPLSLFQFSSVTVCP